MAFLEFFPFPAKGIISPDFLINRHLSVVSGPSKNENPGFINSGPQATEILYSSIIWSFAPLATSRGAGRMLLSQDFAGICTMLSRPGLSSSSPSLSRSSSIHH
jgi:hypothetical protein